jgi:uncharacterized protein YggE
MKRNWLMGVGMVVISMALVFSLVGFSACSDGPTNIGTIDISNQQTGIWVSGEGEVTVTPDIATLYLGIEAKADSVAEAQSQAQEAMEAVMDALEDNGVDEDDIQTQYFSIDQDTRWDSDDDDYIVLGYEVTNTVEVKVRDIDNVGVIIDAVAETGGDLTRINYITFSVDDPSEYYEEVREEAMADAKAKAEQLASLAGVELGAPTYISEGSVYNPVDYRDMGGMVVPMAIDESSTSISPGELEITLSVQVAYAIEQ